MLITGHKTEAVFSRYHIVDADEVAKVGDPLSQEARRRQQWAARQAAAQPQPIGYSLLMPESVIHQSEKIGYSLVIVGQEKQETLGA